MKCYSPGFLIFIMFLSFSTKAQNYLEMPVTIQMNNGTVESVLNNLEKQLHFNFSYEGQLINEEKKISINEQNKPLEMVLKKMFSRDFEYKVVGTHVIIQSNLPPVDKRNESFSFTGQVLGPDNKPLENAIVYEANRKKAAFTSYDGYYNFTISDKNHPVALNISSSGLKDTIIYISQGQSQNVLNISLAEQRYGGPVLESIERQEVPALTQMETKSLDDLKLVKFMVPDEALYMSNNLNVFNWQAAQVSLVPYLGTNDLINGRTTNNFSLNVIAGYTAEIKGVEFGAVANIIQNNVSGFQVGGVANFVGKNVNGSQAGGVSNFVGENVFGFQAAGVVNIVLGNLKGAQAGGVVNIVRGNYAGAMISGVVNITEGGNNNPTIKGIKMQVAGVANIHKNDTANIQVSSVYNDADYVKGTQISAVANFANQSTKGVQLSALFNYSNTLEGVQFGFVNVADTIKKGVQIGLINIVKNGYKALEISSNETFYINAAYKTGGNHLYSFVSAGYGQFLNAGFGLGYTTNPHKKFSANLDLTASAVLSTDSEYSVYNGSLYKFQVGVNYKIARHLTVSVGPSFNIFNVETGDDLKIPSEISSSPSLYYGSSNIDQAIFNQKNQNWFGWHCSLRF